MAPVPNKISLRTSKVQRLSCSEAQDRTDVPGSKRMNDLSEGFKPRTNTETSYEAVKEAMGPNQRTEVLNSSLLPNQPMERTPPCCALRRRSSAR